MQGAVRDQYPRQTASMVLNRITAVCHARAT